MQVSELLWSESQDLNPSTLAPCPHLVPSYRYPIRGRGHLPVPKGVPLEDRNGLCLFISSPSSVLGTQGLLMELITPNSSH